MNTRLESALNHIPLMQLVQTMWLHLSHRWYVVKSNLEHLEHLGNNDFRILTITDFLIRQNFEFLSWWILFATMAFIWYIHLIWTISYNICHIWFVIHEIFVGPFYFTETLSLPIPRRLKSFKIRLSRNTLSDSRSFSSASRFNTRMMDSLSSLLNSVKFWKYWLKVPFNPSTSKCFQTRNFLEALFMKFQTIRFFPLEFENWVNCHFWKNFRILWNSWQQVRPILDKFTRKIQRPSKYCIDYLILYLFHLSYVIFMADNFAMFHFFSWRVSF